MATLSGDIIGLAEDEKRMWLRSVAEILLDPWSCTHYAGPYENRHQIRGYSFCYRHPYLGGERPFLMISRHNSSEMPSRELMASELRSTMCEMHDGNYGVYYNRSSVPGFYASVKCGNRWYMISQAGVREPRHAQCFPGLSRSDYRMSSRRRDLLWG